MIIKDLVPSYPVSVSLPGDGDFGLDYPLYDITSSPLSARSGFGKGEVNGYRVGHDNVRVSNFGVIEIDTVKKQAHLSLRDRTGETLVHTSVFLR